MLLLQGGEEGGGVRGEWAHDDLDGRASRVGEGAEDTVLVALRSALKKTKEGQGGRDTGRSAWTDRQQAGRRSEVEVSGGGLCAGAAGQEKGRAHVAAQVQEDTIAQAIMPGLTECDAEANSATDEVRRVV